jgi:flagellar biosynthetic protein FliQ
MNAGYVIDLGREVISTLVKVAAPLLIVSLVIGLIVSVLQTITSIQEQTLTFVPKFIAIMLILMLFGGWMMNSVVELFTSIMEQVPKLIK